MAKKLTRLRIDEVSSVDRGAGEGVKIMLMKRDFSREQRDLDAKSGAAMSDGSFPIENKSDLHNAMRAVGRAKNPAKAKAHIRARARALGLTSELSDAFKREDNMSKLSSMFSKLFGGGADNSAVIDKSVEGLAESVTSILGADDIDDVAKSAALTKSFEQFGEHLKSTLTAGPAVAKKEGSDMDLSILKKALGLADTATDADVQTALAKSISDSATVRTELKKAQGELKIAKAEFTPEELAHYEKAFPPGDDDEDDADGKKKAKKAFRLASHQERASTMKAAEPSLPAHIQKIMDDNAAMAKRLAELEAGGNLAIMTKRAVELGLPDTEGVTLQKAYAGDKSAVEKLEGFLKSAIATAKTGGVFKEFGISTGTGVVTKAYDELTALAKNLQKTDPKLNFEKAFAKVYEDPANAEIVRREREENRPSAA